MEAIALQFVSGFSENMMGDHSASADSVPVSSVSSTKIEYPFNQPCAEDYDLDLGVFCDFNKQKWDNIMMFRHIINDQVIETIQWLDKGANIECKNLLGDSPLLCAVRDGNLEMAWILMDRGAKVDAVNRTKQSALMYAVERRDLKMVQELIYRGSNVNHRDECGNTALHYAARTDNIQIAELLLHAGCSINTRNHLKHTALMVAVKHNRPEMVNLLLANFANACLEDRTGTSAYAMAMQENKLDMAHAIQDAIARAVTITESTQRPC